VGAPRRHVELAASPEALFALSGITQYTGAVIAVSPVRGPRTGHRCGVAAWPDGGVILLLVSGWCAALDAPRPRCRAAIFGVATALMNLFFYLAIDRIPLGKSVVIEFVGPIALAAVHPHHRNSVALVLAATGVIVLRGGDRPRAARAVVHRRGVGDVGRVHRARTPCRRARTAARPGWP
jgi:inner membrane transporter RhtA